MFHDFHNELASEGPFHLFHSTPTPLRRTLHAAHMGRTWATAGYSVSESRVARPRGACVSGPISIHVNSCVRCVTLKELRILPGALLRIVYCCNTLSHFGGRFVHCVLHPSWCVLLTSYWGQSGRNWQLRIACWLLHISYKTANT
jgi:hypothetical protein